MIKGLFADISISVANDINDLDIRNKDLLVNATPVGLKETDPCLVKEEALHKNLFVYDLIYNPPNTKLLSLANKIGARTSNGLGMLLYQAVLAFKHFVNIDVPTEEIFGIMQEGLRKAAII